MFATARKAQDVATLRGLGLEAFALDLDSSESIRAGAEHVLQQTRGKLYGLINNGAYGLPGAVEDLSRAALRAQFETNVFGTQELTNCLLPAMRTTGEGRIIQISSLLGIVCLAYRGAYSASKFALEALSDTMRLELRGTNIHVALIEPGPIKTRFRVNAHAAYRKWINKDKSAHRDYYTRVEARLGGDKPLPFTLPPDAVLAKAIHALEAGRPRLRYPVTVPARWALWLRRVLPGRALDRIAAATSGGGTR